MPDLLRVYIAGPISKGDRADNFANACKAQRELIMLGFAPLNPMISMLHPNAWTIPYEKWMEADLAWVSVAEAVLRLPGESEGADREVAYACKKNIPVFLTIDDLVQWAETRKHTA